MCSMIILSSLVGLSSNYTVSLDCSNYNITMLSSIGLSQSNDLDLLNQENCYNNSFTDNMNILTTCNLNTIFSGYFNSLCLNMKNCLFPFNAQDFTSNCIGYTTQNIVYFTYQCSNSKINSFGGLSKSLMSIISISVDILSMLVLITLILL